MPRLFLLLTSCLIPLALIACGGGSSAAKSPAPKVSLIASPASVPAQGSTTLTWTTTNASSCSATGAWSGSKAVSGSEFVGPLSAASDFRLTCSGPGGTASATATVSIAAPGAPAVSLGASPTSIVAGQSSTLSWNTTGVDACSASGGWTGAKPTAGTESTGSLSASTTFTLDCTGPGGSARDTVLVDVRTSGAGSRFPLRIDPTGRHLLDASGKPYLLNGDAAWSMMAALTAPEVAEYLDDRRARGFNAILVSLIEHEFVSNPPRNAYGDAPFSTPEDIRTPVEAYFNRCVEMAQLALDRQVLMFMTPAYLGFRGGSQGWWSALANRTEAEVQAYGEYVGAKFTAFPNIVWVMGGDYWDPQVLPRTRALVQGLKSAGRSDWLFTYHGNPNESSSAIVGAESWLDLNATYAYEDPGPAAQLEQDYGRTPVRPFFLFESRYEQEPSPPVSRLALRSQAYWAVLTGGFGAIFGNNPIWHFSTVGLFPFSGDWRSNLDSSGARDRTRFAQFVASYDWSSLRPDRTNSVLTGGRGSGPDTAYAAISADASLILAYTPVQKALTIDMSRLSGSGARCRWFNPSTAVYTDIASCPITGPASFTTPGTGDWVLVVQSSP